MNLLRWAFTKEGSASTPRLSAGSASVVAGSVAGLLANFRFGEVGGVLIGLAVLVVLFAATYPALRDQQIKDKAGGR